MKKYVRVQVKKIEIDKWYEGCRINNDPGEGFILDWIENNAGYFRNKWNASQCKNCINWKRCGYELLDTCDMFEPDSENL